MSTIDNLKTASPDAKRLGGGPGGEKIVISANELHTGARRSSSETWLVPQVQLFAFLGVVEGNPPETIDIGLGITIQSYIPLRFQYQTSVVASSYTAESVGKPRGVNDTYDWWHVNINYESPRYAIVGPTAMQSVNVGDGSKSIPTPYGFPLPVPGFTYSTTMHRLNSFNLPLYVANSGTVNASPWREVPRGQALFTSPLTREEYLSDGSKTYDITTPIIIASYEHNYEVDQNGNFYKPEFRDGQGNMRPKHLYVDFTQLFGN